MKTKITVILISIFVALMLISNGYGVWNKSLRIEGDIKVVPELDVLEAMESQLDDLEKQLDEEIMSEQNLAEEQLRLQMEENELLINSGSKDDVTKILEPIDEIVTGANESSIDDEGGTPENSEGDMNEETGGKENNPVKERDGDNRPGSREDINKRTKGETENPVGNDNNDIVPKSEEDINEETEEKIDNIAGSGNNKAELNESGYESDNNSKKLGGGGHEGGN